jgi:hypothetical protein
LKINRRTYRIGHTIPKTNPGGCQRATFSSLLNLLISNKVNGNDTINGDKLIIIFRIFIIYNNNIKMYNWICLYVNFLNFEFSVQ